MSEYQRYEFMTVDRPLTPQELREVESLSSHIEASSSHAFIEYHWGDFKHDPIAVLREFFDGFLYWANWGSPQVAFRFPHGMLPANLLEGYDLDEWATFSQHADYDILDIHFGEMESPDEWTDYELGELIGIREELMEGDLRSLYIAWLAEQRMYGDYDEDENDDEDDEDEDEESIVPPVPPGFSALTAAQAALAELFQVPHELLVAAGRHSEPATPEGGDNITALVLSLPGERKNDYLVRLAHNEPGLSRRLVKELRELNQDNATDTPSEGKRVSYAALFAESAKVKAQLEREKREQERAARERHLQDVHARQDDFWHQVDQEVSRGSGPGYDEATRLLVELREVAVHFKEMPAFQERFLVWIRPHLRRPAFIKRLQTHKFSLPEA